MSNVRFRRARQLKSREKTTRNKNAEGKSDTIPLTFRLLFGPDKGIKLISLYSSLPRDP